MNTPLTPAPLLWKERDKGREGFIVGEKVFIPLTRVKKLRVVL
jgi:hypothetical protein